MTSYIDLAALHDPTLGVVVPVAWLDGINTNFQVLRADACLVKRTSNQTLANDTPTNILFNAEREDSNAMHDNSTNPDRINILRTGIYLVSVSFLQFTAHATGFDYYSIQVNGGTADLAYEIKPANSSIDNTFNVSFITRLAASDYLTVLACQTSGGNLDIIYDSDGARPNFGVTLLKDLT